MKSSCLSCTGVSRNNLMILRNLTQLQLRCWFRCLLCPWRLLCRRLCGTRSNPIVFQTDLLCNQRLVCVVSCLKRYQFLWLRLINFRRSKFGTKPCLFAPISIAFVSCQFAVASVKALVRCGFHEWAPSPACKSQLNCLWIGRWQTIIMILKWQANSYVMFSSLRLHKNIYLCANIRIHQLHMNRSSLEPPWIAL